MHVVLDWKDIAFRNSTGLNFVYDRLDFGRFIYQVTAMLHGRIQLINLCQKQKRSDAWFATIMEVLIQNTCVLTPSSCEHKQIFNPSDNSVCAGLCCRKCYNHDVHFVFEVRIFDETR